MSKRALAEEPTSRLQLTGTGWAMTVVACVGILVGWALGWSEFVIVGFGVFAALLIGAFWAWRATALVVDRQLATRRVIAGQPITELLNVSNPGRFPAAPRTIVEFVGDRRIPVRLPMIAAGATHEVRLTHHSGGRGLLNVGPTNVGRTGPLGLVVHDIVTSKPQRVVVHPRVHPLVLNQLVSGSDRDSSAPSPRHHGGAFRGVRSYESGDDMRSVHWPSTAKQGELMVRQLGDTSEGWLAVFLDTHSASYQSVADFESAIEVAASLLAAAARQDLEALFWAAPDRSAGMGLRTFSAATRFSNPLEHLDACAVVEQQAHATFRTAIEPGLAALTSGAGPSSLAGAAAVVITGADDATVARGLGPDAEWVQVIRCAGRSPKELLAEWSEQTTR